MITPSWFFLGPATIPAGPSADAATGAEAFGSLAASSTTADAATGTEPAAFLALALTATDPATAAEAWLSLAAATITTDASSGTDAALSTATLYGTDTAAGADAALLTATLAVQTDSATSGGYAAYSDVTSVRAPATGILVVVETASFAEEGIRPVLVPVYGGGFCETGILVEPKS